MHKLLAQLHMDVVDTYEIKDLSRLRATEIGTLFLTRENSTFIFHLMLTYRREEM